ncbi:MAG: SDR family oxidoreductase [candidate division KSB1 bacterium]|nr:SDR family oxidoreductase [candidate division KSB1 bacterium]MDZ7273557.1 SDR family oxidoreductase [candidate division KSB1 bacterium]MDZ7286852.1 SDR family oxidoreductase [candidate division KSB1 bacterium]MDZ7299791.1 SDR family oxidoreductase [candidate division KSB1 bacterium]MDZ7309411.1 SDR family oxidoreductase [candidate division KSB1 bacterium]
MTLEQLNTLYDLSGRTFVITGGTGVLGREMTCAIAGCRANVALLTRTPETAAPLLARIANCSGRAIVVHGDVCEAGTLRKAADEIIKTFGRIDGLVNGAGGNNPRATTSPQQSFFQLSKEALEWVINLNLMGTILPSQIFGKYMAEQKEGVILNVSSMNAIRPLTRIPAYSAAKAAVSNFTQWLAVHMAQEYSPNIRVNAIAPGFFLTEQNRFLLTDKETGELTPRGKKIIEHTPMGRFGKPQDLLGTTLWLLSPASAFVTGVVVPVDGGFSAFSGV